MTEAREPGSSDGLAPARRTPAFTTDDLAYLLHPLAPLAAMAAAARLHGRLQHLAHGEERRRVRHNLEVATNGTVGRRELSQMTRRAFEYRTLRRLLLTLHPKLASGRAGALFPVEGLEHLERARAAHGGVIVACSHINSVCNIIAIERLRSVGFDIRVALPTREEPFQLSAFRRRLYRVTGGRTFTERTGAFYAQFNVRPILRALSQGAGVVVVADGWHSAGFVEATFLGRRAQFTTGAASVARVADTAAVPLFAVGTPPDGLRFVFEEPIVPDPSMEARADVERMVKAYAARLEPRVQADLACWQHWFEDHALETMERLTERPLEQRYHIGAPAS